MLSTPTDPRATLALLHLTDSALPTGAFAHSAGLEMYLERELVTDADSYSTWLNAYIAQAAHNEGLAARFAAELATASASADEQFRTRMRELDHLTYAGISPRQVRDSYVSMGKRMGKIVANVLPDNEYAAAYTAQVEAGEAYGNQALVFGVALGGLGLDTESVVRAFFMQMAASITQNAIRGIPLGQDAGQRVLARCHPVIESTVERTMALTPLHLGVTAPGLELAQMAHEGLVHRMFMS